MKKRILFVNKSFELGGIQTALKNMLSIMSEDEYDVDLLVFNNLEYKPNIFPEYVNLVKCSLLVQTLGMTFSDVLKRKNLIQILFKIISTIWAKIFGNRFPVKFAFLFQKKLKGYDYAVAYHHEVRSSTMVSGFARFILDKVEAKTKLGWIHSDFSATGIDSQQNFKIYSKLDKIISVSKSTMNSFIKCYPQLADKCDYCYNILPINDIIMRSKQKSDIDISARDNETVFFSACRLVEEKGLLRTLNAMHRLKKENLRFKWYIAGDGVLRQKITECIDKLGLKDTVYLLGYTDNVYPYIKQCDWLLLPSYHETFSLSAAEAVFLNTPVLATDISVVRELIDSKSGYICPNSEQGIENGLKYVLTNKPCMNPWILDELSETHLALERIFK